MGGAPLENLLQDRNQTDAYLHPLLYGLYPHWTTTIDFRQAVTEPLLLLSHPHYDNLKYTYLINLKIIIDAIQNCSAIMRSMACCGKHV